MGMTNEQMKTFAKDVMPLTEQILLLTKQTGMTSCFVYVDTDIYDSINISIRPEGDDDNGPRLTVYYDGTRKRWHYTAYKAPKEVAEEGML